MTNNTESLNTATKQELKKCLGSLLFIKDGWQLERERSAVQGGHRIKEDVIMAGITGTLFVIPKNKSLLEEREAQNVLKKHYRSLMKNMEIMICVAGFRMFLPPHPPSKTRRMSAWVSRHQSQP